MSEYTHETIKVPEQLIAWFYLHFENRITSVPTHWHRSLEITLILRGRYAYVIDGKKITAEEGNILIINGGSLHSCGLDGVPDTDAFSVIIPYEFLKRTYPQIDSANFSVDYGTEGQLLRLKKLMKNVYPLFKNRRAAPFYQLELNGAVYRIVYSLLAHFMRSKGFSPAALSKKYQNRCNRLIAYIDERYNDPVTLEMIARDTGITKEHLARFFKEHMGTTIKKYLTAIRMHHAYRFLIETDLTELEIALNCGFPDSRSFISAFKRIYGTTPLRYRKTMVPDVFDHQKSILSL